MYRVIIFIISFAFFQVHCIGQPTKSLEGYQIGDKAADFELKEVDGAMYSLNAVENANGYIVIFTSNTCPFAVAYEDRIIELHNKMAPQGYPVVAINSNDPTIESGDSFEEMVTRHDEKNFPFLYLKDGKESIFQKFGANKTPHVFLLDKNLLVKYIGAIDDSPRDADNVTEKFVENAIAAIEKGETPDPETTKAIGCPIKTSARGSAKNGRPKGPPSPQMLLERMDANKDNEIARAEAHGPLVNDFDRLDSNKDGKLTMDELSKMGKGGKPRQ